MSTKRSFPSCLSTRHEGKQLGNETGKSYVAQTPTTELDLEIAMPKPKVLIFDVNETLLDLAPLKASVGKALGGQEILVPLWFSTMLHYSLVLRPSLN